MAAAGGSMFSPTVLGLMAVLLIVGVTFGYVLSSSMKSRAVYNARSEDAARILEQVEPMVANLREVKEELGTLKPTLSTEADVEKAISTAKSMADKDIAPEGSVYGSNRLLLGPMAITMLTDYTADSALLGTLLDNHHRRTKADKDDLLEAVQGNKLMQEDRLALFFDYQHLAKNSGSEDYMPPSDNRLVTVVNPEKDEEGKIEVKLLNSDQKLKTLWQHILPLKKSELLKMSSDAAQSYQQRVREIQFQMQKVDQQADPMLKRLDELANKESAPLVSF